MAANRQAPSTEPQASSGVTTYSRWQLFFLERLQHMRRMQADMDVQETPEYLASSLRRAVFSTLLDCDAAGVGDDARRMMSERSRP